MNFKNFQIPSVYTIWDGLSLKTISRYCPFKLTVSPVCLLTQCFYVLLIMDPSTLLKK
jgi:hypothetical protein